MDTGQFSSEFPYRAKALFAFQEMDGHEVCFFGMHTQEYGSDCPPPNTRKVYISYLDSVFYFRPRQFRSAVYHEIILGYLDFVKQLGLVSFISCTLVYIMYLLIVGIVSIHSFMKAGNIKLLCILFPTIYNSVMAEYTVS